MALVQPKSQSHAPGRPGPRRRVRPGARTLGTLALAVGLTTAASGCMSGQSPVVRKLFKSDTPYAEGAPETENGTQDRLLSRWLTPDKTPHASESKAPGKAASVVAAGDARTANTDAKKDGSVGTASNATPASEGTPAAGSEPETPQRSASPEPGSGRGLVLGADGWKLPKAARSPDADAEMADAEALYQQGSFARAESALARIAKKRKGSQYGEKAQFLIAESNFQRGRLVAARDGYEQLIKDYPGTKYLDQLVNREYTIALTWLGLAGPARAQDAGKPPEPVELKKPPGDDPALTRTAADGTPINGSPNTLRRDTAAPPEVTAAVDVNSIASRFDGRQPFVDTSSHAVKLLENIRLHDPSGPFADDAAMKIAEYHKSAGDFEQAAYFYEQVVNDHPKSPLLQKAQKESIECRLKAYIGPEYDGDHLEKARNMVKQTMVNFPERRAGTADDNEVLYKALDIISDQEAERAYRQGEFYERTRHPTSAEYYYGMVSAKWPNSEWAKKAKQKVSLLAKVPRKESLPSKIMSAPGSSDPLTGGAGAGAGGLNGMGGLSPNGMMGP